MDLDALLRRAVELGATDVHLKEGKPPILRRDGALGPMEGAEPLTIFDLEAIIELVGKAAPARLQLFHNSGDLDVAYQSLDLPRFRVNAFRQRGSISFAFRVIPKTVPTFDALSMPPGVARLTNEHRGLILVTGATGSGKTTTLAAMIGEINRTRTQHIVTIEDPIEILHSDDQCIVNQREVGLDTESFGQALRRALRQDPDVILIGELRDSETAQTALQAAESGHLVLSTMHTIDATETVGRMIEFFPEGKQQQIRSVMAGVLRGVVSQRLLPKARRRPHRRCRGDGEQRAHRRADPRGQDRADRRGDRGRRVLRHADLHEVADRPRRLGSGRQGGRGERLDQPARLPRHARARAQAAGRRRDRRPRKKRVGLTPNELGIPELRIVQPLEG